MAEFVKVTTADAIPSDDMRGFEVNGVKVAIASVGGELYAFHNCCTHQQFELTDGFLMDDRVTCTFHGATFDVKSGDVVALPATQPLPVFELKIENDEIWVAVPDPESIELPPE